MTYTCIWIVNKTLCFTCSLLYMFAPGCFTFDYKIKYRGYNFLNQIYLCLYFIHFHKKSYVKFYSIFISDLKLKKKVIIFDVGPFTDSFWHLISLKLQELDQILLRKQANNFKRYIYKGKKLIKIKIVGIGPIFTSLYMYLGNNRNYAKSICILHKENFYGTHTRTQN